MRFFENVYEAVQLIPRGKVATYGQIARMIGAPRSSRAVGYALHANPRPGVIPCHRVVNREGRLAPAFAFGGPNCSRAKASKWAKTSSSTSENTFGKRANKLGDLAAMILCDFDFLTYEKPPRFTAAAVCLKSRPDFASIAQTQSFFTFCHCSGVPR